MGGAASTELGAAAAPAAKKASERVGAVMRRGGDKLNLLGFPEATEMVFDKPSAKPHRVVVCRCWQSLKFPLCDNSHQRLQKQGVKCGPLMLEIKASPNNVGASSVSCSDGLPPSVTAAPRSLGSSAFLGGGFAAGALAGAAHFYGVGPFPF
eukprot:TRINITY_DN121286_c0_g1_i1.p1 TRINITY_DN121286_c0_g1~~TRINITY_DN121286_c0_g1_i1.p1  ORF type:complete len:152 (-),score=22.38 TRINITY_DN121286_c0_g1_i1:253-708(-)